MTTLQLTAIYDKTPCAQPAGGSFTGISEATRLVLRSDDDSIIDLTVTVVILVRTKCLRGL